MGDRNRLLFQRWTGQANARRSRRPLLTLRLQLEVHGPYYFSCRRVRSTSVQCTQRSGAWEGGRRRPDEKVGGRGPCWSAGPEHRRAATHCCNSLLRRVEGKIVGRLAWLKRRTTIRGIATTRHASASGDSSIRQMEALARNRAPTPSILAMPFERRASTVGGCEFTNKQAQGDGAV